MSSLPHLVGMIHLQALPGSPRFNGSVDEVTAAAVADAQTLVEAGFPALMIENFGDAPFFPDKVPPWTVAAMTSAANAVADVSSLPFGINVLRNDVTAAIGVAATTGAAFVRVNVLTGVMYTDQGPIEGRAAEVVRTRAAIAPEVEIWADVMVKHATAPMGLTIEQAAADTAKRGLADAVIVSGSGTGAEPDVSDLKRVREAIGDQKRLVVGSGAAVDNLQKLLEDADSIIVGSALKRDGDPSNPVDPVRAELFAKSASDHGLL